MNRDGYMVGNGRAAHGGRAPQGRMMPEQRGMSDSYNTNCGCGTQERAGFADGREFPEIPAENQMQLLKYIDEVSFCAYDLMLYLDTHPEEEEAMARFGQYNRQRDRAVQIYEEKYGPLRFGYPHGGRFESAKWVGQEWPWEGGEC
ncbi:MAG: spore coat protein CotJB [Lachnospiraceae bacterium]|nr:spore coat protein CotJB [Lachnospiraceae bacterium]